MSLDFEVFFQFRLILTVFNVDMAILHSLLAARAIQSQAVCVDQFAGMDNKQQQSPCLVLAYVLGACQGEGELIHA